MRWKQWKEDLTRQRPVLAAGSLLLVLAAVLALGVIHSESVLGACAKVAALLNPLLCGVVVAFLLNVLVRFLEDVAFRPFAKAKSALWRKLRHPLAVVLAYLLVAAVIFFICYYVIPHLLESLNGLVLTLRGELPELLRRGAQEAEAFVDRHNLGFVRDTVNDLDWSGIADGFTKLTTDFLGSLFNMTVNVASGVFTAVMGVIFSVYMLTGKRRLLRNVKASVLAFLPEDGAGRLEKVGSLINQVFSSFVRGQLTECLILGTLCYLGMSILRLDYALLVSFLVMLGPLVPILGAYLSAAAGALILLVGDPVQALIFLVFLLILMQVEANLVYPRIVGASIGLPPMWTVFAVLFWGGLLGIPGVLVGTPATAVIYRLLRAAVRERLEQKGIDPLDPKLPTD